MSAEMLQLYKRFGNTSRSTRSSEATAMMPSCDQSIALTQHGQHFSSVTSAMTAASTLCEGPESRLAHDPVRVSAHLFGQKPWEGEGLKGPV
jgi:hypothetical protein